jgi:uncharacterized protein YegL
MPDYANNASERQLCTLVLDASHSMTARDPDTGRTRIELLNDGIKAFHEALHGDEKALVRAQIAAIRAGGTSNEAKQILDWTDGVDFVPFALKAGNETPLGAAVLLALNMIEEQKRVVRRYGVPLSGRPWLFVLTDGEPTDAGSVWRQACQLAYEHEAAKKVLIYSIGVGGANLAKLGELSAQRPPRILKGINFREFFLFVSTSISAGELRDDLWSDVMPEQRP